MGRTTSKCRRRTKVVCLDAIGGLLRQADVPDGWNGRAPSKAELRRWLSHALGGCSYKLM